MAFKEILIVLGGLCVGAHLIAYGAEASLNKWIGKYPTQEFFKDIKNEHLRFLPERVKRQAIQELTVIIPIQKLGDFLIVQGCKPHQCPWENYAFFVGMTVCQEDYVCMWKMDRQDSDLGTMTWYGTSFKSPISFKKVKAPFGCSFKKEKLQVFVETLKPKMGRNLQEKAILTLVHEGLRGNAASE